MSDTPEATISPDKIKGNASLEVRNLLSNPAAFFTRRSGPGGVPCFGDSIHRRMVVTEAYIQSKREDEQKKEAVVIVGLDVTDDMTNSNETLHGGCSAYLVDLVTTLVVMAYSIDVDKEFFAGVSQSINTTYHSPAVAGERLRIVSYTVAGGSRAKTARCEIWNATQHRLVAAGVHVKMAPSTSKSKL
ncbi:hypothetical protein AGABI2DRAFT_212117 [Agaricus bisporus var. bisporus H97]|uniref:hypothetical protein n=1 Tax=Agaricus bisporus var. bisporus (strain H97 / ATCC MYA-4626 / FGSC 10389) TaxID=936046 RepID=UPI00029F5608|nr:hypothetical protein AGABI2DRAFT_212117 [Agaricus bisporus var. bisporus H97]EKV42571.1 hypothetical protein AGABI2DRAFT_212117 [Agaricus bisporus var. bisporus H97]